MKIERLSIPGAAVVEMEPFEDHRGLFSRWFCQEELQDLLEERAIVNINFSRTEKAGAVRGMHFQHPPVAEMKLIRCLRGKVFDVMVDLRKDSPTFLEWVSVVLTPEQMNMVVVPEGVAHGFQTLEEKSEMLYLHTAFYSKEQDAGVRYNDPAIGIKWPSEVSEISEKDGNYPLLDDLFEGICL